MSNKKVLTYLLIRNSYQKTLLYGKVNAEHVLFACYCFNLPFLSVILVDAQLN